MPLPDLLPSIPPSLSHELRRRSEELRCRIVRANHNTQFVQTAPELAEFRHATTGLIDEMDDVTLSNTFQKTVHCTKYASYASFITRFFDKSCKASAVVDLLAPGLPDYLIESSSTSGGLPKTFPKYNRLSKIRSSDARPWVISDPSRRRTLAYLYWLGCDPVDIEGDDVSCPVTRIYLSAGSAVLQRMQSYLDPEKDEEKMGTFILDHAAPYAAGFVKKWRSFLLVHALFAVGSRSLETMSMVFISTFVDMIRHLDMEFDVVVDCIANGAIPDLDGTDEFKHHLESNIFPDPERAAELRNIGRPSSRPGWCGDVWPNLRSINATACGSFASTLPLAQWFLGRNTDIHARGYASSEAWVGSPYNLLEPNQFKLSSNDVFEFLDISKSDSPDALTQPWEVEQGKRYEVVVTTQDGLWRYLLEDVIEISGFDPSDGIPVIQFIERRNVVIRFPDFMLTEKDLRVVVSSVDPDVLTKVVNWTATIDDRQLPATIGFFVELAGDQVSTSDLTRASERAFDELLRLKNVRWAVAHGLFRKPTMRFVRPGTFSDFLQLKLDEGNSNLGQNKVPVVLPKAAYVTWFSDRIVREV